MCMKQIRVLFIIICGILAQLQMAQADIPALTAGLTQFKTNLGALSTALEKIKKQEAKTPEQDLAASEALMVSVIKDIKTKDNETNRKKLATYQELYNIEAMAYITKFPNNTKQLVALAKDTIKWIVVAEAAKLEAASGKIKNLFKPWVGMQQLKQEFAQRYTEFMYTQLARIIQNLDTASRDEFYATLDTSLVQVDKSIKELSGKYILKSTKTINNVTYTTDEQLALAKKIAHDKILSIKLIVFDEAEKQIGAWVDELTKLIDDAKTSLQNISLKISDSDKKSILALIKKATDALDEIQAHDLKDADLLLQTEALKNAFTQGKAKAQQAMTDALAKTPINADDANKQKATWVAEFDKLIKDAKSKLAKAAAQIAPSDTKEAYELMQEAEKSRTTMQAMHISTTNFPTKIIAIKDVFNAGKDQLNKALLKADQALIKATAKIKSSITLEDVKKYQATWMTKLEDLVKQAVKARSNVPKSTPKKTKDKFSKLLQEANASYKNIRDENLSTTNFTKKIAIMRTNYLAGEKKAKEALALAVTLAQP